MLKQHLPSALSLLLSGGLFSACGSSDGYVPFGLETVSELASSVIAGTVNATESGGNFVQIQKSPRFDFFKLFMSPAYAASANTCPTILSGTCSANKILLTYNACSFELGGQQGEAVWTGSQTLAFDGGATCSVIPTINTNGTLTRTFADKTTRTGVRGLSIDLNTSSESGYDSGITPKPSGGIVTTFGSGNRTLDIRGVHLVASYTASRGNNRGQNSIVWDHTFSTEATVTISGTAQNRSISAGTIVVQQNIQKFTGKVKIDEALKFTSLCCYPVGGRMKTELTGARTGTETLEFGGTCGEAKLTDSEGTEKTITLRHCL